MKNYAVKVPFAGYMEFLVEAEDEESAKQVAMSRSEDIEFRVQSLRDAGVENQEWGFQERLTQGNFSYLPLNKIEVEEY